MPEDTWIDALPLMEAIQKATNGEDDSKGMVTKFVAVAEVMDDEGKKLVAFRGPNSDACPVWDAKALLREIADNTDLFCDEEGD